MMTNTKYKLLFEPTKIGKVQLKNRFVKVAAQTYLFDSGEHRISSLAKAFYGAVAKGGAGLVIVETPAMEWPLAEEGDRRFRVDDDKYINDIRELTEVIHKHNCPAFVQFYHRGAWGGELLNNQLLNRRVAASAVTLGKLKSVFDEASEEGPPKALTITEIEEITERYISGALRVAEAGFDGLEINTAGDHLGNSFLSRFWNKRSDIYGSQNMENRTRFVVNILRGIKKRVGQDFPVQVLMNALEIGAGDEGINTEEAKEIAKTLQEAGADSLHIRSHWLGVHQGSFCQDVLFYPEPHIPLKEFPKQMDWSRRGLGANVPLAAIIKGAVSVPVMTVGGLDADLGENVLRDGKADLIGINRRFFADPEYVNKVAEGRLDDIAPCTHCNNCNKGYNEPRHCRINASFGREQYEVTIAADKKKVVVVGGGPAGMQTARVAALRGHDVTLFEKGHYLGGSLPLAAMVKGFELEDLPAFIRYFKGQIKKLGVNVYLSRELTPEDIDKIKPDVVVLALGGIPTLPDVSGINGRNVTKSADLYRILRFFIRFIGPKRLRSLTKIWMPIGKNVVIIGGAIQGCQLGEFLTKRGRKVTIVDTDKELGKWMYPERKTRLFYWFRKKGVKMFGGVKLEKITPEGLSVITNDDNVQLLKADKIIPAMPLAPNLELMNKIKDKVPVIYTIGDCANPGIIPDATAAGWEVGNKI
jgi:2,4-dienoyl-CoA reductase (NADPH2)